MAELLKTFFSPALARRLANDIERVEPTAARRRASPGSSRPSWPRPCVRQTEKTWRASKPCSSATAVVGRPSRGHRFHATKEVASQRSASACSMSLANTASRVLVSFPFITSLSSAQPSGPNLTLYSSSCVMRVPCPRGSKPGHPPHEVDRPVALGDLQPQRPRFVRRLAHSAPRTVPGA